MSYPFVQSFVDLGPARGPRLALIIHMAEGGGTVGYLSRKNPNGVAVHFVIQGSGRIVQMLRLDRMQASIRASSIRTTDDPDGFYGATARTAVMGKWGDVRQSLGPNHASIGVEIEGFAKNGPNPAQNVALAALCLDLAAQFPGIRALGHRDFASYKACPGKKLAWRLVGGHGPKLTEEPVPEQPVHSLEDSVIIVREFAAPKPATVPDAARSFLFNAVTGDFRETNRVAAGQYDVDATVRFIRDTAPKGTFVRIVTGSIGRRLVSAGNVEMGG